MADDVGLCGCVAVSPELIECGFDEPLDLWFVDRETGSGRTGVIAGESGMERVVLIEISRLRAEI